MYVMYVIMHVCNYICIYVYACRRILCVCIFVYLCEPVCMSEDCCPGAEIYTSMHRM